MSRNHLVSADLLTQSSTKQHIRDMRVLDPNEPEGYGPYYTRALDKGLAYVNADSYTWLALVSRTFLLFL